ncbi:MAG: prepilin-type N-terminal cleavage/methylation domain-containing protein [Burkholderiaceae bacterium]|nr:prepilin-type N-terminal cleavage/methylation domain-containing protein [Burkholderiaceae bacterium]
MQLPSPATRSPARHAAASHVARAWRGGFTLIELMVVIAIIAIGSAMASLALRDSAQNQLAREGERLAALLETARAISRASGVAVQWRPTAGGFAWDGLPPTQTPLPTHWLDAGTAAVGNAPVLLGPDPVIGPQTVQLRRAESGPRLELQTDGLRPFVASLVP